MYSSKTQRSRNSPPETSEEAWRFALRMAWLAKHAKKAMREAYSAEAASTTPDRSQG